MAAPEEGYQCQDYPVVIQQFLQQFCFWVIHWPASANASVDLSFPWGGGVSQAKYTSVAFWWCRCVARLSLLEGSRAIWGPTPTGLAVKAFYKLKYCTKYKVHSISVCESESERVSERVSERHGIVVKYKVHSISVCVCEWVSEWASERHGIVVKYKVHSISVYVCVCVCVCEWVSEWASERHGIVVNMANDNRFV